MSRLDVKIDTIVNIKRDTTALFVGNPIAEYYEGIKLAREHYSSPLPGNVDVMVGNCSAKVNEMSVGMTVGQVLLPDVGGTLVMITNNPMGEVCHYLRGKFGKHISRRGGRDPGLPSRVKKSMLLMPHKHRVSAEWYAPHESVNLVRTWDEVLAILEEDYPDGARVAVIPDAAIQLFDVRATLYYIEAEKQRWTKLAKVPTLDYRRLLK